MKYLFSLIVTIILGTSFSSYILADEAIKMYLDYARFRYDETQTYLEIYYGIHQTNIQNSEKEIPLRFYLNDLNSNSTLASSDLEVKLETGNIDGMQGSVIKTVLPPGDYQVKMVRMANENQSRVDSIYYDFSTTPFENDKIKLSDLELCAKVVPGSSNSKSLFFKNTMEVYPNPTHLYGLNNPEVHYYIELYNIRNEIGNKALEIQVAIKDADQNTFDQKSYFRTRENESLVEVGSFDVSEYRSGLYTLIFAVVDHDNEYSVFNINNFYVLNPGAAGLALGDDVMAGFPSSPYFTMSDADAEERFNQARYIATPREIEIFKALGEVEGKRVFMYKFWWEREKENPGLQQEYYERVEYANEAFGYTTRKGWDTDMGRVHIMYGEPNRILGSAASLSDKEPFKVWIYHDLEGGVRFLFIDESGFNDFRLVTSTMRGELYDPNYQSYLSIDE